MPTRSLKAYRDKRLTGQTPEPFSRLRIPPTGKLFVVQQHRARHLHFDLRLEMDGVLVSWAVPKGPSDNPNDKRFAAFVEDHPLDYADFEGRIPKGNYGAGYVIVWDRGTWLPLTDPHVGLTRGKLLFELTGHKLKGRWTLVRTRAENEWLLIKEQDAWACEPATEFSNNSILSGLDLEGIAEPGKAESRLIKRLRRDGSKSATPALSHVEPMLATPGEAFDRAGWVFELKYDGYRIVIEKSGGSVVLRSRNGHDLTGLFPEIAAVADRLPYSQLVLDGELVVNGADGRPSFSRLQQRARLRSELEVARAAIEQPCLYYAFDLLQACGYDLRESTLVRRKRILKSLVPDAGPIRYSEHVAQRGLETFRTARRLGIEGIVAKQGDSRYRSGRSSQWIKVRHQKTDDFVVVGWAAGRTSPDDLGALALAEYRDGTLTYVGRVGSGFRGAERTELAARLRAAPKTGALADDPRIDWRGTDLVAEVRFTEYTADGHLRHPVFVRLRDDKPATECSGSLDNPEAVILNPAAAPEVAITNADKVFFPEKNLTKADLVGYYSAIAPWMLPYLENRPIVLTRYPDGIHGKSFYQRDAPEFVPGWIERAVLYSDSTDRDVHYFIVNDEPSLRYLANLGTIPIHAWHSRLDDLEHPDWLVLDLDPKTAPFEDVIECALSIGELCEELDLPAYVKTSGSTGLHVLIPANNRLTHGQARTFAELLARVIVMRRPEIATIARAVASRQNKVYIDYLQNGHGRLLAAPFSARAEPAASISMPVSWHEVNRRLTNERFHMKNAVRRMQRLQQDPLAGVLSTTADLERALERLAGILG